MLTSTTSSLRKKRHLETIGNLIAIHPLHAQSDVIVSPNHFDISFYHGPLPVFFGPMQPTPTWPQCTRTIKGTSEKVKSFEHLVQKRAIDKAIGAMWASRYAMNAAISDYGADPDRQLVTGFGLNLPTSIQKDELEEILGKRDHRTIRLMFIGFDYKRKGLDICVTRCCRAQ